MQDPGRAVIETAIQPSICKKQTKNNILLAEIIEININEKN